MDAFVQYLTKKGVPLGPWLAESRAPRDYRNMRIRIWYRVYDICCIVYGIWHVNIRILQTTISGIRLVLNLGARM